MNKTQEKLKEITDRLETGVSELFESERYKEYLTTLSKLHSYSATNTLLIYLQKPDAQISMIGAHIGDPFTGGNKAAAHLQPGRKGDLHTYLHRRTAAVDHGGRMGYSPFLDS